MAIKRLRARLQEAAPASSTGLPLSQLTILHRLRVDGPATAAALAAAEHISQQAVAQNLAALKRAKLVKATPDKADGRKVQISITRSGHSLFAAVLASRTAWLARAIAAKVAARERPALDKAIEILERLAEE